MRWLVCALAAAVWPQTVPPAIRQGAAVKLFDTSSVGGEPYYVNDHTLVRGPGGNRPVARLAGHAAEWLTDDGGRLLMAHAGAGQKGVSATPVDGF